jgi:hypothetical protein
MFEQSSPAHTVGQLRNTMLGKFLRALNTKTAILDHTNMATSLSSVSDKFCTFRVLPRYRVRSEGELVSPLACMPDSSCGTVNGGRHLHGTHINIYIRP